MNELCKFYKISNWIFSHSLGGTLLAIFNITAASLFVTIFFSIGYNLYDSMVIQYNVNSNMEQFDVFVSDSSLSSEDETMLTDGVEMYRKYFNTEIINEVNEQTDSIIFGNELVFVGNNSFFCNLCSCKRTQIRCYITDILFYGVKALFLCLQPSVKFFNISLR